MRGAFDEEQFPHRHPYISGSPGAMRNLTVNQAREFIAKEGAGNYRKFEMYDTRRPIKRAWGEHLEEFLRSRGACGPCTHSHAACQVLSRHLRSLMRRLLLCQSMACGTGRIFML